MSDLTRLPTGFVGHILPWLRENIPSFSELTGIVEYGTDWSGDTSGGFYAEFEMTIRYRDTGGVEHDFEVTGETMASLWRHVVSGYPDDAPPDDAPVPPAVPPGMTPAELPRLRLPNPAGQGNYDAIVSVMEQLTPRGYVVYFWREDGDHPGTPMYIETVPPGMTTSTLHDPVFRGAPAPGGSTHVSFRELA
jgi:hypothetical protein